jgi:hypothetical protein
MNDPAIRAACPERWLADVERRIAEIKHERARVRISLCGRALIPDDPDYLPLIAAAALGASVQKIRVLPP